MCRWLSCVHVIYIKKSKFFFPRLLRSSFSSCLINEHGKIFANTLGSQLLWMQTSAGRWEAIQMVECRFSSLFFLFMQL